MFCVLCLHIGWAEGFLTDQAGRDSDIDYECKRELILYAFLYTGPDHTQGGKLCAFADERVKSCDCDTCIRHRRYLIESQTLLIILSKPYSLFKRYLILIYIPKMNVNAQILIPNIPWYRVPPSLEHPLCQSRCW
jgi:hypothetical protein